MAKFRTRASAVVLHNDQLLCFLGVDPKSGREYHFLPGGVVEPHETAPETAERECLEETGFQILVDTNTCVDKEYPFHWNGEDFECLTLFYGARLKTFLQKPRPDSEPDYNRGPLWIPTSEVASKFSYTPEILQAIEEILPKLNC